MSVAAQVFVIVVAGVLGLVVGSFLNVVVYRVPAGVSLLRASACPTCDVPIRWQQNVPVLSWVALRGRCAHCGSAISPRYPLVEAATALGVALVASVAVVVPQAGDASWWLALAAFLYLAAITVALALIDVDVRRLPDGIVLPSYGVAIVLLALSTLVGHDLWPIVRATIGMAALYTFYLLLRLIRPDGMGGGDVKLAGLLGWYLAWLGWGPLVVGAFTGFLWGGIFGVALLLSRRGSRASRIPFGPWMLLGAWTGIVVGAQLTRMYLGVYTS